MPFKSKSQQRACYAKKSRGQAGSWDCDEFSEHTDFKKIPEKVKESALAAHFGRLAGQQKQAIAQITDEQARSILPGLLGTGAAPLALGGGLGGLAGLIAAPSGRRLSGALRGVGIGAGAGLGGLLGGIGGGFGGGMLGGSAFGQRNIGPGALAGAAGGAGLGTLAGASLGKDLMWFNPEDYEESEEDEARKGERKAASDLAGRLGQLAAA